MARAPGFFARLASRFTASSSAYTTTGTGQRSLRWRAPSFGPNAALDGSAEGLRNQSRDQVRKNPIAAAAVERISSNVIGTGIKPKWPTEEAQALWLRWTDESDAAGILDFYGQQKQTMDAVATAGEIFVRMRTRRPQDGLSVPLQLELLESEFCPIDKNEAATATRGEIRQGIEFDRNVRSRRVAYWMYPRHPHDNAPGAGMIEPIRIPASEVLHVYWPTRPGQVRGEPWMARILDRLKDVESYDKAELTRKKISAMFVAFLRRTMPEGLTVEELAEVWGDDAEINGGVGDIGLEPGSMQVLAPGEDIQFSDPKDVGGQYEVFMRAQHRAIAASLGLLYEQLVGDYSTVNDRTWRAAVSEFRRRCEGWQHHLIVFQLCRPVGRRWAELALLSGALQGIEPAAPVPWVAQAWPYINPLQDVQARREEVRAGFTSRTRVVAERGEDVEVIDAEQKADNDRADSLGLKHESDMRQDAKGAAPIGHNGGPPLEDDDAQPNQGQN